MSNLVNLIGAVIGAVVGVAAIVIASLAWLEQRKQTQVMAAQVDKQVEIKLTKDLGDDDTAPRSVVDATLRKYLNNRLSKVRADLRDEFHQRLVELALGDASKEAIKMLSRQADAVDRLEASANRVDTHEHEIQSLQRAIENLRRGDGAPDMVRMQVRRIAELLLSVTGQDQASNGWAITDTLSTFDAPSTFDIPSAVDAPFTGDTPFNPDTQ